MFGYRDTNMRDPFRGWGKAREEKPHKPLGKRFFLSFLKIEQRKCSNHSIQTHKKTFDTVL